MFLFVCLFILTLFGNNRCMIDKQPPCGHATAVLLKSYLFRFISFIYSLSPKIIGKDGFSYFAVF